MYLAIDLKSFYASVECAARGLDPLKTNLVVADAARTEKTICLAVSPSLKAYGIAGRARLFEVVQRVEQVNAMRRQHAPGRQLRGQSENADTLAAQLTEVLMHPERLVAMGRTARSLAKPDATRSVVDICLEVARG